MLTPPFFPLNYPFPERINLYADIAITEVNQWLDTAVNFLSAPAFARYRNFNFAYAVARSCPDAASYKHLRACTRSTMLLIIFNDHYKSLGIADLRTAGQRLTDILEGAAPSPQDNWLFHQAATNRSEIRSFMPEEWYVRFLKALQVLLAAAGEEIPYITGKRFPSLAAFMAIRERSAAGEFYSRIIEMQLGMALPAAVAQHPHILHMSSLLSRLLALQHDLYSRYNETGMHMEVMNLIPVLQQEYHLSLQEACEEARRIHDTDLETFIGLQRNFPDFGAHQQLAEDYVQHMGLELQGYNSFYLKDTLRYMPGGYAEPEYTPAH